MSKVMIIDDSKDIGVFCELVANMVGVEATYVENVQEGMQLLERGFCPDVILLDLYMPGRQPEEIVDRVNSSAALSGTRVVLMSSVNDVKDFATHLGAHGSLSKPFNINQLAEEIQSRAG